MRIAFDGTTLTAGRTGVGYYTEHLLQHLASEVETTGDELIVISNQPIETAKPLPSHVRVYTRRYFPVRIAWMQFLAARVLEDVRADVAHFTNGMLPLGASAARVVTIHDMSLRLFPWCHPTRRLMINRPLLGVAARVADAVVTVSHSARRDLLQLSSAARAIEFPSSTRLPGRVSCRLPIRYDAREFACVTGCPSDSCFTLVPSSRERTFRDSWRPLRRREREASRTSSCASDPTAGHHGTSISTSIALVSAASFISPAMSQSKICRSSTTSVSCSSFHRCTRALACRSSRRWRAERPSSLPVAHRSIEIAAGAAETVDPHDTDTLAETIVAVATDRHRQRGSSAARIAPRAESFRGPGPHSEMLAIYAQAAGFAVPHATSTAARPEIDGNVAVEPISREAVL